MNFAVWECWFFWVFAKLSQGQIGFALPSLYCTNAVSSCINTTQALRKHFTTKYIQITTIRTYSDVLATAQTTVLRIKCTAKAVHERWDRRRIRHATWFSIWIYVDKRMQIKSFYSFLSISVSRHDFHSSEEGQRGHTECKQGWQYKNDLTIYAEYDNLSIKTRENYFQRLSIYHTRNIWDY